MRCGRLVACMNGDGRQRQGICGVIGVLITLITIAASSAAGNHQVTLTVEACPDVSQDEIERILGIELRTIAAGKKEVNAAPTLFTVRCNGDRALLNAVIEHQDKSFYQTVPLTAEEADEKERLIAITAAELVFSAWVAVSPPKPEDQVEPPEPTEEKPPPVKRASDYPKPESFDKDNAIKNRPTKKKVAWRVEIGPLWRMYRKGPSHFLGGELSVGMTPLGPLHVRADLAVEGWRVRRTVGRASCVAVSGAIGVGVLNEMVEYFVAGAVLGGRFGWADLKGESSDQDVTTGRVRGGFGGPMLELFFGSSTNPYALLTAELGYAFYGAIGHLETSRVVATTDIWISTLLAIGIGF